MIRSATIGLGLLALVAAAPASAQAFIPDRTVAATDDAAIMAVIRQAGATADVRQTQDGARFIAIEFSGGQQAVASFTACNEQGRQCRGLLLRAVWNNPEIGAEELLRRINVINASFNTAKLYVQQDGRLVVSRYVINDGGRSMGNLQVEVAGFGAALENIGQFLYEG